MLVRDSLRDIRIKLLGRAGVIYELAGAQQMVLQHVAISNAFVPESIAQGGAVGTIVGSMPNGTTLELVDNDGGRFALVAGAIQRGATPLDYDAQNPIRTIIVRQTNAGATPTTLDTPITINVTNIFEQPALGALTLSPTPLTVGQYASISILGATVGSVITGTIPPGMTLNSAARTITGEPAEADPEFEWSLSEALGDSPNSPRANSGTIAVAAAPVGDILSAAATSNLVDRHNATYGNGNVYQANENIPLATDGFVMKVTFAHALSGFDPTKLLVNIESPGFTDNGVPFTRQRTARGVLRLRRATPNPTQPFAGVLAADQPHTYYVVLDNLIYAGDTVKSIVVDEGAYTGVSPYNFVMDAASTSTLPYPECLPALLVTPFERIGSNGFLPVEISGVHEHGQAGQMFACVEAWLVDKNGLKGQVARTNAMQPHSLLTPAAGWMPGYRVPSYQLNVSSAGLADGPAKLFYKAYPFVGTAWDSTTKGVPWPSILHQVDYKPVQIDVGGAHKPIYAWVNQDQSAGASAAIQAPAEGVAPADPGQAGSYATAALAAAAAKVYNNANRGHNDCSGLIIMTRDVAGSTMGQDAGAYNIAATVWSSASTYPMGDIGVEVRRAADPTTPSDAVRLRWTGASLAGVNSKQVGSKVRWRGLKFDSTGKTAREDNTVINGSGPTGAVPTAFHTLIDCDVQESANLATAVSVFSALYNTGLLTCVRTRIKDATTLTGASSIGFGGNSNSVGGAATSTGNIMHMALGCSFETQTGIDGPTMPCTAVLGCYSNMPIGNNSNRSVAAVAAGLPILDGHVIMNVRLESKVVAPGIGGSLIALGPNFAPVYRGAGGCNILVVTMGNYQTTAVAIANDAQIASVQNIVFRHLSMDTATTDQLGVGNHSWGRLNWMYNEQGFAPSLKRGSISYSVVRNFNQKGDWMNAPETLGGSNWPAANVWTTGKFYSSGYMIHDGGTPKTWYQAKVDHVAGATMATDLANGALWRNLGQIDGVAFSYQPLRTGNWQTRYNVRSWYNVFGSTANGSAGFDHDSWFGEARGRGAVVGSDMTTWWVQRHAGGLRQGDYRPKAGSPLLNKVPAGSACIPTDLLGTLRLNNGTGAAGAFERTI